MALVLKIPSANVGDIRDISSRSPGGGQGNLLQCSCLENPMDRGAWRGYGPWGHEELDRTEQLSKHASSRSRVFCRIGVIFGWQRVNGVPCSRSAGGRESRP